MKSQESNTFTADLSVSMPEPTTIIGANLVHWFNREWTGNSTIPFTKKIDKGHLAAAYRLHRSRRVRVTFQIAKNGSWKALSVKML
jgi:hypothetical protein